jgi:hypothetical protein
LNFLIRFSKNIEISNFVKISSIRTSMRTDGQAAMMKLIVFFSVIMRKRLKVIGFRKIFLTSGTVMTPKSLDFTICLDPMKFLFFMLTRIVRHFLLKDYITVGHFCTSSTSSSIKIYSLTF